MPVARFVWLAAICVCLAIPPSAFAAEGKAWDITRTTSPESAEELKALQDRVKDVNKKVLMSTVGIIIGPGAGSGVIVSEDGLVLTAAHVILNPRKSCTIVFANGKTTSAETLGVNSSADSGMLKLGKPPEWADWPGAKDGKWPFVEIGKAADVKVGQWLVAMGHPGGPKQDRPPPVRLGRLRSQSTNKLTPAISTDCTLVGGDSGGPLYTLDGKVVGIHSRIGFTLNDNVHIPTDKFKEEWDRLARGDKIGVRSDADFGIVWDEKAKNARVASVVEEGAAWKVDIEEGDVITKFNGYKVATPADLREMLSSYQPGDKVKVEVERNTKILNFEMKLGRRPNTSVPPKKN